MARAAFPIADRVSLADVGEYRKRQNDLHEGLARDDVQAALVNGCGVELIWLEAGAGGGRENSQTAFFPRSHSIFYFDWGVARGVSLSHPPRREEEGRSGALCGPLPGAGH